MSLQDLSTEFLAQTQRLISAGQFLYAFGSGTRIATGANVAPLDAAYLTLYDSLRAFIQAPNVSSIRAIALKVEACLALEQKENHRAHLYILFIAAVAFEKSLLLVSGNSADQSDFVAFGGLPQICRFEHPLAKDSFISLNGSNESAICYLNFSNKEPSRPVDGLDAIRSRTLISAISPLALSRLVALSQVVDFRVLIAPAVSFVSHLTPDPISATRAETFTMAIAQILGIPTHWETKYNPQPLPSLYGQEIASPARVSVLHSIEQYHDLFEVISLATQRAGLLDRYWSWYQTLENLTVRRQIASLITSSKTGVVSLRDFKKLAKLLLDAEQSELETLKGLLTALDRIDICGEGITMREKVQHLWAQNIHVNPNRIVIEQDVAEITRDSFSIVNTATNIKKDGIGSIAKLIYSFRNAIAHNKANEFHLTYATLKLGSSEMLNGFLVPLLRELVYVTVFSDTKSPCYYPSESLRFYPK